MLWGKTVRLRYYEPTDLEFVCSLRGTPESYQYFFEYEPLNSSMQKAWWENSTTKPSEKNYIVSRVDDNSPIGTIALVGIDYRNRRCEFGRLYIKQSGLLRTAAVESELLILDYAFNHLNLQKVTCEALESNKSVISLHQRFGFEVEGVFKNHVYHGGEYKNVVTMGLSKERFLAYSPKVIEILAKFES